MRFQALLLAFVVGLPLLAAGQTDQTDDLPPVMRGDYNTEGAGTPIPPGYPTSDGSPSGGTSYVDNSNLQNVGHSQEHAKDPALHSPPNFSLTDGELHQDPDDHTLYLDHDGKRLPLPAFHLKDFTKTDS